MSWADGRMTGLDTESTGTDATTERVISAAVVHVAPGQRPRTINWLIHPGRDVPDEAAAVHGWTPPRIEETLRGHEAIRWTDTDGPAGRPKETALFEIAAQAATVMGCDSPLVVHNAAYDMTLLEAEFIRNNVPSSSSRPAGIRGLVDPMVIEKQWRHLPQGLLQGSGLRRPGEGPRVRRLPGVEEVRLRWSWRD